MSEKCLKCPKIWSSFFSLFLLISLCRVSKFKILVCSNQTDATDYETWGIAYMVLTHAYRLVPKIGCVQFVDTVPLLVVWLRKMFYGLKTI